MADTLPPGQVAWEAFWQALNDGPMPEWHEMLPTIQRAWEAAAGAVRADAHTHVRTALRHWHVYGPDHAFVETIQALERWLAQAQAETPVGTKTARQAIEEIRRLVGHYFAGVDPEAFVASLRSEE